MFKMLLAVLLVLMVVMPVLASDADYVFDIDMTTGPVLGFGAQIWPGDTHVNALLNNLNCKFVRMDITPNWTSVTEEPPTDGNRASFDAYCARNFTSARINYLATSWTMTNNLDIQVIANQFHAPSAWLGSNNVLRAEYHQDFALLWGAQVALLDSYNMRPPYVDLFNEPEGDWNVYVAPASYNAVVKLVRAELDARGFYDVGIVGPGLAWLDHNNGGETWVNALDNDAVDSLTAWATHAWDESYDTDCGPEYLEEQWTDFGNAVNNKDPLKPIFVTEYMTGARTFNGITYDSPGSAYGGTAAESDAFAVRVFQNTLTLLNCGAGALVLWEAADQYWSESSWGLLRRSADGSTPRPAYFALYSLLPKIPELVLVLQKTWTDNDVVAAAFIKDDVLVAAFANGTANIQQRIAQLTGLNSAIVTAAWAYENGSVVNKTATVNVDSSRQLNVELNPESTLTVVMTIERCRADVASDLNGDCQVDMQDFAIVARDYGLDSLSSGTVDIEDFESYANNTALNAFGSNDGSGGAWGVGSSTASLSLSSQSYHDSQAMLYEYNNGASPWWAGAMKWLTWPSGTYGQDWRDYQNLVVNFKCLDRSGYLQVTLVNHGGTNVVTTKYNGETVLPVGDWTEWAIDLHSLGLTDDQLSHIGRVDLQMKDGDWNYGSILFDDIYLTDSSGTSCQAAILTGDVNDDCYVDMLDVLDIAKDWLSSN